MSSDLKRIVTSKVPAEYSGRSLIDYLCQRYSYNSRESWLKLISEEKLIVNDAPVLPDMILSSQDKIDYHYEGIEPEVDFNYSILYEDSDVLVINKPGDLPVHPAGKFFKNTLWAASKKIIRIFISSIA